ncbi:MAG: zf-HC2 domain-containing protein [Lachnospiraceae bacterium]|nr:zf-HC2 domain-containing protein [Lachnospiraceae bacterium]
MDCKEAQSLVMPYILNVFDTVEYRGDGRTFGELTDHSLAGFLDHLEHCPKCRDELEIYYVVYVGLRQLEVEDGIVDMEGNLAAALESSRRWAHYVTVRKVALYVAMTLFFYVTALVAALQLRMWFG